MNKVFKKVYVDSINSKAKYVFKKYTYTIN